MNFLRTDVYVQAGQSWMSVMDLKTEREASSSTLLALPLRVRRSAEFVSDAAQAEAAASRGDVKLLDGFGHDRVFIGNFEAAGYALKLLLKQIQPAWWLRIDRMVFHVQREMEGGLTGIEKRASRDLCAYAGARRVRMYLKPTTLSLREVRRLMEAEVEREPYLQG